MGDKDKAILCSCSNEDCRWNGCMIVRQQLQKPEIVYAGISRGQIAKPCVYEDGRPLREIIESQQREIDRLIEKVKAYDRYIKANLQNTIVACPECPKMIELQAQQRGVSDAN